MSFLFSGTLPSLKPITVPGTQQDLSNHISRAEVRLLGSPREDGIGAQAQAPSLCLQLPGAHVLHRLEAAGGRVWDR